MLFDAQVLYKFLIIKTIIIIIIIIVVTGPPFLIVSAVNYVTSGTLLCIAERDRKPGETIFFKSAST